MERLARRTFVLGMAASTAFVSGFSRAAAAAAEPSARSIMDAARDAQRVELASFSEMLLIDAAGKSRARKIELKAKKIDGAWRSYLKFGFPPDIAGTQFLILEKKGQENDMFLYQPVNKRTRRITTAQRTGRFVGTDFYYEDLDVRDVDKDEHSLLRQEDLKLAAGGKEQLVPSWVIQSVPKAAWPSSYSRVVTWVERSNHYPRQVELFKGADLVKRFRVFTIETSGKSIIPKLSQMDDLKSNTKTILQNQRYSLDRGSIPDQIFSEAYLLTGG